MCLRARPHSLKFHDKTRQTKFDNFKGGYLKKKKSARVSQIDALLQ